MHTVRHLTDLYIATKRIRTPNIKEVFSAFKRARFLLGGRHGEFKFLPPPGYAPCFEAVLPREKLRVEHTQEYKQDHGATRDLLGPTVTLSQAAFTPTPVDTSQVLDWTSQTLAEDSMTQQFIHTCYIPSIQNRGTLGLIKVE